MELQYNEKYIQDDKKEGLVELATIGMMITPAIGEEDYWIFKVQLTDEQVIIAFPKFNTYGIGFMKEEDWNTNLPYECETKKIYNHIKCNKGDSEISWRECQQAIKLIQDACMILNKGILLEKN